MSSPTPQFSHTPRRRTAALSGKRERTNRILAWATVLTLVLSFIPFAGTITWPLRMLVTFVHEGWHALATFLTGGIVNAVEVVPQGSGSTISQGGIGVVISSAGYLGAMFTGTVLLAMLRRGTTGNRLLAVLAIAVGLITCAGIASPFTLATGFGLTLALALAANRLPRAGADFVAGFVGIQCALNAFYDMRTLFLLSVGSNTHTDAMNMQESTLIPAVFWAVLWLLSGFAMVWRMLLRPILGGK